MESGIGCEAPLPSHNALAQVTLADVHSLADAPQGSTEHEACHLERGVIASRSFLVQSTLAYLKNRGGSFPIGSVLSVNQRNKLQSQKGKV